MSGLFWREVSFSEMLDFVAKTGRVDGFDGNGHRGGNNSNYDVGYEDGVVIWRYANDAERVD